MISTALPGRGSAASASDGTQMWLFGGQDRTIYFADLWHYDGTTWTQVAANNAPPARSNSGMVYANGELWLFGGRAPDGTVLGDLWRFNGGTWAEVVPNGAWPTSRQAHGMVFNASTSEILLLGGSLDAFDTTLGDTWRFDLGSQTWSEDLTAPSPAGTTHPIMTYDTTSGRVIGVIDG